MTDTENLIIQFTTPAHTLQETDQIIVDGDLFIIHTIDDDRDDIDEILVKGENLSDGPDEFVLFADDEFQVWAV